MKKPTIALWSLSALLTVTSYSSKANFKNMFTGKTTDVQPDSVLIANESFPGTSKFEIVLFNAGAISGGNSKVWLSLQSKSVSKIRNGTYRYSDKNVNTRKTFNFYGALISANAQLKISNGVFELKHTAANTIAMNYDLTLENGSRLTGVYNGLYRAVDRRL